MVVLEGFDHGDDRVSLCFRALEATDLEWEPGPVDEETDNDLWVDSAFFRVPDLSQVIFFLCFEI